MEFELIRLSYREPSLPGEFELVERKGRGHPDTLSERLAERLSKVYCTLTREHFGTILRHQFDKLSLMGGRCDVTFGGGRFRSPVRLLINGRVTARVGDKSLHFRDVLFHCAQEFLEAELRNFDFTADCRVILETSSNPTRGVQIGPRPGTAAIHHRFRPRTLADLPEHARPLANDTSLGCAWAPYSDLEEAVLEIEQRLTSDAARRRLPWIGSDVKIMARRMGRKVAITVSAPQVSSEVQSAEEYISNAERLRDIVLEVPNNYDSFSEIDLCLNPGDVLDQELLYMKFTGSSIESGDEGVVGRGNRMGGLISSCRSYSMEGLAGKNPAYHAGKLYSAAAWDIANRIWNDLYVPCEVFVASQIDRPLDDPWMVVVRSFGDAPDDSVQSIVEESLADIREITDKILSGTYPLV